MKSDYHKRTHISNYILLWLMILALHVLFSTPPFEIIRKFAYDPPKNGCFMGKNAEVGLTQGYIRDYDLERQCSKLFGDILERHRWNPYILISSGSCPPNLVEKNGGLLHGWYEFESIGDEGGRWTNGSAQLIWFGEIPLSIHLRYTLPPINVIRDLPVLVGLERLIEHPQMQLAWQLTANLTLLNNNEREKPLSDVIHLNPSVTRSEQYTGHNVWRISLLSPSWKPVEYSLSADERSLSIFVHKVSVNGE